MSISHTAITVFGIYLNSTEDAEEFLLKHGVEDYEENDIAHNELGYTCLNFFTGDGCVLGFGMELGETIDEYQVLWDTTFPDATERPRAILEVVSS